jgi:spore maturation protein CgeB
MHITFLGSSLLSSYWNGAATYFRGILAALARRGCRITFYEPDAFERQQHRDIDPPPWARVVVYPATLPAVRKVCAEAAEADVVVKASGVGVFDDEILRILLAVTSPDKIRIFWDVDAPATLASVARDAFHPLRSAVCQLDLVLTYGGGQPVVAGYQAIGARQCVPIYNALDPATHFPTGPEPRFEADLAFLGNRLPDREARAERFFFGPARMLPDMRFLIGGSGWEPWQLPPNVRNAGHVSTRDHNAFNSTPGAVINIARDSMADIGYSPATRIFEAAGAGACVITDAWEGIDLFLEPGTEILVANDGADVARLLATLTPERARQIGTRALHRVAREHTYERRADTVVRLLDGLQDAKSGAKPRRATA